MFTSLATLALNNYYITVKLNVHILEKWFPLHGSEPTPCIVVFTLGGSRFKKIIET